MNYKMIEQYDAALAAAGNEDTSFSVSRPSILVSYSAYNSQSSGSLNVGFAGIAAANYIFCIPITAARHSGMVEVYLRPGSYTLRHTNNGAGNAVIKSVLTIREL